MQQPKIILTHESFDSIGSWAITPILASSTKHIENVLLQSVSSNGNDKSSSTVANQSSANVRTSQTKWIILCEDQSIVDLKALINNLQCEDYRKVSIRFFFFFVRFFMYIQQQRTVRHVEIYGVDLSISTLHLFNVNFGSLQLHRARIERVWETKFGKPSTNARAFLKIYFVFTCSVQRTNSALLPNQLQLCCTL